MTVLQANSAAEPGQHESGSHFDPQVVEAFVSLIHQKLPDSRNIHT